MSRPVPFATLRTSELRQLLQDEDKINQVIRCSDKVQGLQRAAAKMMASNRKLAKVALSQKPTFRDAKLLLAKKYKELETLRSITQAKQEQLAEKYSLQKAQWCLLRRVNHAEEESELLFQRFVEGQTPLAEFLDSFLSLRKRQHISLILLQKLQEVTDIRAAQRPAELPPDRQRLPGPFSDHTHNVCLCGLSTAVLLLPFDPQLNQGLCPARSCLDWPEPPPAGRRRPGQKWPSRGVRLQPLNVQHSRHGQAPQ